MLLGFGAAALEHLASLQQSGGGGEEEEEEEEEEGIRGLTCRPASSFQNERAA